MTRYTTLQTDSDGAGLKYNNRSTNQKKAPLCHTELIICKTCSMTTKSMHARLDTQSQRGSRGAEGHKAF